MSKNKNVKLEQGQSNFSPVILSGREGSMDSSANAFRMTSQSGRSMVEMLGVLAIIGVLSVGGIAGYKMAMNKHRANEILQGASMRAMVVSAQIQTKPTLTTPSLGEFTDTPAGVTMTVATRTATDTQFKLNLSGVDKDVCAQMKAVIPNNSNNPKISDDDTCSTLTYNNDLSAGEPPISQNVCTESGGTFIAPAFCVYRGGEVWNDAKTICARIGAQMVTRADVGCAGIESGPCPNLNPGLNVPYTSFWTKDCYDTECEKGSDFGTAYYLVYHEGGMEVSHNMDMMEYQGIVCK